MSGVRRPWAKLLRDCREGHGAACRAICDCPVTASLSLIGHSADVAAMLRALLELPVVGGRMARLLGQPSLKEADLDRLTALAALHDLGKINQGFQRRPFKGEAPRAGHVGPLVTLFELANDERYAGIVADLCSRGRLEELVHLLLGADQTGGPFNAIMAHHGSLPAIGTADSTFATLWAARPDHDPIRACADLILAIRRWCPEAFATADPPAWKEPFGHAFAGLLILADWLGSDIEVFPFPGPEVPDGIDRYAWSLPRARRRLLALRLHPSRLRDAACERAWVWKDLFPGFAAPSPAQQGMLDLAPAEPGQGRVCLIEDETGSGKTEAALLHFLDLFRQGEVDGLYLALPTRAAAAQIHKRLGCDLRRLLGQEASVLLAVPGYLPPDGAGAGLPDPAHLLPDERRDETIDRIWAAERPKRYLAAWAAVGTIDQLLMGALKVRHAHLRSAAMLRLLLVIDEVHSSDVYMTTILRSLLAQHHAAGGHALLMSATLGGAARARLLSPSKKRLATPPHDEAVAAPYPAVWTPTLRRRPGGDAPALPSKVVTVVLEPAWREVDPVVARAVAAARQGARVLVIRNTVRLAVATHEALEATAPELTFGVDVPGLGRIGSPHHARYAREDRLLLDHALEVTFGKKAERGGGCVAVTSQTAEQSLDIDADLLITDLCPADVLLQRIGRLHRHRDRNDRAAGFARAEVVIVAPGEDELAAAINARGEVRDPPLALGLVYPDLVGILATRRALETSPRLEIPQDNRRLVEAATHPDHLKDLAHCLGGVWSTHWGAVYGDKAAQAQVAAAACIDWPKPIQAWPELNEKIRTRLLHQGIEDRVLPLPDGTMGPFGQIIRRITIPGRWLKGVPVEAELDVEGIDKRVLHLRLADRAFVYDRLGLRPAG